MCSRPPFSSSFTFSASTGLWHNRPVHKKCVVKRKNHPKGATHCSIYHASEKLGDVARVVFSRLIKAERYEDAITWANKTALHFSKAAAYRQLEARTAHNNTMDRGHFIAFLRARDLSNQYLELVYKLFDLVKMIRRQKAINKK